MGRSFFIALNRLLRLAFFAGLVKHGVWQGIALEQCYCGYRKCTKSP